MLFTADFETTTDPNDCRVWATGICTIDEKLEFFSGNCIEYLFDFAKANPDSTFYFHNEKFDGEFIMCWLFEHGYKYVTDRKMLKKKAFTTLISDAGQFYSMEICFDDGTKAKFLDSLKILPFPVDAIAKQFNLPISKLDLDYEAYREPGHILTEKETHYLRNDVEIMARALKILFDQDLKQMTQGSNALYDYKKIVGKKNFNKWFPIPDYDMDIRQSYKGGFTYCDPRTKGKDIEEGIVLDVNSLYPWVMYACKLPYGEGIFFEGEYEPDELYDLYVQMLTVQFKIKPNHIPTIQLKNNLSFIPTEYLESSGDEEVTLCLTSVDLELFKEHYDIISIEYHSGWKFKSTVGLFKDYIDKWMKIKIDSEKQGNMAMRKLAKLMLNALYGKFALSPFVQSKIPYYNEGKISYTLGERETRKPIYIPVGTFITAWARYKTITSAQKVYDRFLYADTDSLHLRGWEIPDCLEIDQTALGCWKIESKFTRARFLRQKSYIEEIDGILHITCAGLPDKCYKYVTWDNFKFGTKYKGKLKPTHVVGGIVLEETEFTLKGA